MCVSLSHTPTHTVVMTAAVLVPDWMADTSPALPISSGGNHSNNTITIPEAKLLCIILRWEQSTWHDYMTFYECSHLVFSLFIICIGVLRKENSKSWKNPFRRFRLVSIRLKYEIKCSLTIRLPTGPQHTLPCVKHDYCVTGSFLAYNNNKTKESLQTKMCPVQ